MRDKKKKHGSELQRPDGWLLPARAPAPPARRQDERLPEEYGRRPAPRRTGKPVNSRTGTGNFGFTGIPELVISWGLVQGMKTL